MSVTPATQASKFLDLRVRVLHIILYGQAGRIVDTHVTSEPEQYTCCFESKESRIRACELLGLGAWKRGHGSCHAPFSETAVQNKHFQSTAIHSVHLLGRHPHCGAHLQLCSPIRLCYLFGQQERPVFSSDLRIIFGFRNS